MYMIDVERLLKYLELKQMDLARLLSVTSPAISKVRSGSMPFPETWKRIIEKKYGDLKWGDFQIEKPGYSKEKQLNHGSKPLYDVEAYGGFDSIVSQMTVNAKPAAYINVPYLNHCELFIRCSGDSMYPKICHGDILAIRRIQDVQNFVYGEIYVLVTTGNHQLTTKYVQQDPGNPDNVLLVPYNKAAGAPQSLPKDEILEIWEYLGKISV